MTTSLPMLTVFDPADAVEGTIDPLGLAQLATRLAEQLVPDFRERVRRPRFFTALTVGAAVLGAGRHDGGVYGETEYGPRYLGWERLLVESYARAGRADDADGFIGVPGITKGRMAAAQQARLMPMLYLKNAEAAGWWVAYKGIAAEIGLVDEHGNLLEVGRDLLRAWATSVGDPDLARSDREPRRFVEIDQALAPLLGGQAGRNPQSVWGFLAESLHPRRISKGEADVLQHALREQGRGHAQRAAVIDYLESQAVADTTLAEKPEMEVLQLLIDAGDVDGELSQGASLARCYEQLAKEVMTAFDCVLFAGGTQANGRVTPEVIAAVPECRELFAAAPERILSALRNVAPGLSASNDRQLATETLSWMESAAAGGVEGLFEGLVVRHIEIQKRKLPDGKRSWIEGGPGARTVRTRFVPERAPDRDRFVHPYRLQAVLSCLADLRVAV